MSKKALILLAEGFEEMEAVISVDMLRRAGIEVVLAAIGNNLHVKGSRRITLQADILLKNTKDIFDALILPGGMPGAKNLALQESVIKLIKKYFEQRKVVCAICASPAYAFLESGILSGKKATCYPGDEVRFGRDTCYLKEDVVVDGNIITSAGPGTAFYFALAIIKKLLGEEAANKVKEKALVR